MQVIAVVKDGQVRQVLLIPPLKDWERLQSGELTKGSHFDRLYIYERSWTEGGGVEYHYDDQGAAFE